VGVEVTAAGIANIFEEFDQEEGLLVVMRAKAEVLVKAPPPSLQ